MIISYFVISINHLIDKIHQENKLKFGRNPYKSYSTGRRIGSLFGQTNVYDDELEDGAAYNGGASAGGVNVSMEMSSGQSDPNASFKSGPRGDGMQGAEFARKKAVTVM